MKMLRISLVILLIIINVAVAEEKYDLYVSASLFREKYGYQPKGRNFIDFFLNGNVMVEELVELDGHQTIKRYYPSGQIGYEENLFNEVMNGTFQIWYQSGIKAYECNYFNGLEYGECCRWFENGGIHMCVKYEKGLVAHDYYVNRMNGEIARHVFTDQGRIIRIKEFPYLSLMEEQRQLVEESVQTFDDSYVVHF